MQSNEILQTLRTLGKNKKHVERMVTAYQLYTQEVFRLSYTVGFNFLQFHHLYDPMKHFIAYDQKLYFYNQIYGHLPRVQVFTSKDLNNLLLFHVERLPPNYDCDNLFQRLFTCVKRCGWSANIENESWNNYFLLGDIFILALEPYQIPAYLLQALWNPFDYFYLTPEKTLCWRHYGTPVTLLSFQSFFPQHKFTSGECSYLRKMLGYLKQWFLEKIPTLSAHKYREEHRQSLQTAKAKALPLPREKYKNTTPPIDFLYATTGGDSNLLCQYAKLFSAVAFPLQSPKKLFLLSGNQEDIKVLRQFLYGHNFPQYSITEYCTSKNIAQRIHDSYSGVPYSYLYFDEVPSKGKLSQLELDQISFLKKAVNSVVIHKRDEISGKVYWRNYKPIILYSNHDHFNSVLCNHMKVEYIRIPHNVKPENDPNPEWTLSYLITYGLWLSCGAKLTKLSTSCSMKLKQDNSTFDLFLAHACQYQQASHVHCQVLYQGYTDLCKNLNQVPMSSREFFNYFKNNGNYLWKRTRTKADDYKTYIVNLSYLGIDSIDLHQEILDRDSFTYVLSLMTAEVDNVIQTGATATDCHDCHE